MCVVHENLNIATCTYSYLNHSVEYTLIMCAVYFLELKWIRK
jgi:hypothetical protein